MAEEAVLEVENEVTGADLSEDERALILKAREIKAREGRSVELATLLTGLAEEYEEFSEDLTNFIEKKILRKKKASGSVSRSSTGWLVTGPEGTVFCPNTEQARLYIASNTEKGCPAGTAASLPAHAKNRGFEVTACSDPEETEKYPTIDGLKRVYEDKKRTPFALASR